MELKSLLDILTSVAFTGILVCWGFGGGDFVLEAC